LLFDNKDARFPPRPSVLVEKIVYLISLTFIFIRGIIHLG
jgi:hypothetical protein